MPAIQRLPDDLLVYLFATLADVYPAVATSIERKGTPRPNLCWMVVAHVCRRWREVALEQCSILWGQSFSAFPYALETILSRAKGATLYFDMASFSNRTTILRHLPNAGRIENIRSHEKADFLIEAVAKEARPRLRHLDLLDSDCFCGFAGSRPYIRDHLKPLHPDFNLNAPFMTHCYLPRYIPMSAPRLRVLHIHSAWICSVQDAVHYLSAFPLLEDLNLCLPRLKDGELFDTVPEPFDLSSLRSFRNDGGDSSITALLPYIRMPAMTNVSFSLDFIDGRRGTDLDELIENMKAEILKLGSRLSTSALGAQARSHNTLFWDLWSPMFLKRMTLATCARSQLYHLDDRRKGHGIMELNLEGPCRWPVESVLHPALTTSLGSQPITTLYINSFLIKCDEPYSYRDKLYELLSDPAFSTVSELIVQLPESQAFFSFFRRRQTVATRYSYSPPLLPALSRLVLDWRSSVRQHNDCVIGDDSDFQPGGYYDRTWISNMREMLSHRNIPGYRLKHLVLKGTTDNRMSSSLAEYMDKLKTMVGTVIVDQRSRRS